MHVKATALDSFFHGRKGYAAGDPVILSKGEAADMEKSGLVEIVSEHEGDEEEDLLGEGGKMEAAPQNKMEKAPANKAGKK